MTAGAEPQGTETILCPAFFVPPLDFWMRTGIIIVVEVGLFSESAQDMRLSDAFQDPDRALLRGFFLPAVAAAGRKSLFHGRVKLRPCTYPYFFGEEEFL